MAKLKTILMSPLKSNFLVSFKRVDIIMYSPEKVYIAEPV